MDSETGHPGEHVALLVIENGVLHATRTPDAVKYCPATKHYYGFVDTGQFVSWSMAWRAARNKALVSGRFPVRVVLHTVCIHMAYRTGRGSCM